MSKKAEAKARWVFPIKPIGDPYSRELFDSNEYAREVFTSGYEQAEKDLGWHSVEESLPEMDEEVIVLADRLNLGSLFAIAFGHIVDKKKAVDYNGWNIPGVKFWMPMPKIPENK